MKKIVVVAAILLSACGVYAYDMTETLVNSNANNGLYAAPVARFTQLDGKWGLMFGGRGGWLIDHTLGIGGAGYGLVQNNIKSDVLDSTGNKAVYGLGYGGLEMEYFIESDALMHASITTLLGAGNTGLYEKNSGKSIETSTFYFIEPGINFELNVTKNFRVDLAYSHRFVSGIDMVNLTNEKVNGPSISMFFKFGVF